MLSWLMGYRQEDDKKEEDAKKIEEEDGEIPSAPPILKREQGYYEGNLKDVIRWKNYDDDIKQIREELEKIKIDTDKKWNARLSPVMETRKKKRRKRSTSASNGIKK